MPKSNVFQVIPFHLKTLVHSLFPQFKTFLECVFWDLFELCRCSHFDGIDVRKMDSRQNRFDPRKEKKVTRGQIRGIWGVPKLQCFFLRETDEYSGLCEQEHYRDGAPMRGFPKGSASCHALILQSTEESVYRRFGSLFGLR